MTGITILITDDNGIARIYKRRHTGGDLAAWIEKHTLALRRQKTTEGIARRLNLAMPPNWEASEITSPYAISGFPFTHNLSVPKESTHKFPMKTLEKGEELIDSIGDINFGCSYTDYVGWIHVGRKPVWEIAYWLP